MASAFPTTASRLGHVGINVPKLDEAVELFRESLGLAVIWRSSVADPHGDAMSRWFGLPERARAEFAFLASPGIPVELELMQWNTDIGDETDGLAGVNGRHVALWIDDLDRAVCGLRGHGCTIFEPHPAGFRFARTRWGLYLQLMPATAAPNETENLP